MVDLTVDSCCGCGSVRAGTRVIAVLATISALATLILVSIQTASGADFSFRTKGQEMNKEIRELYGKIAIPYAVILLFVNASLLLGVIKSKREFMLPYLILNGSFLVIYTFLIAVLVVALPIVLVGLLLIAISGYFWLVVYSYYKSLANEPQVQVFFQHQV